MEALKRREKQRSPLHMRRKVRVSIGGSHILTFWVVCEGKLHQTEGLLLGRLSIGQHREQFFGEGPFQMEKGRGGIWME